MKYFGSFLVFIPVAGMLAQTPPPPPKPAPATPNVTMSMENPNSKPMPTVPPDRVLIKVGDVALTAAQVDQIIDSLPEQYRGPARGAGRKQFADNIVQILVLSQEGKRLKLNETPAYQTQSMFQLANMLAGVTFQKITKDLPVDEAAVRKSYEEHKPEYEQVHAHHILIRMQGSPVPVKPGQKELTEAEALAKATELKKKIEGGADFGAIATAESDDSASAIKGGDLGTFKKGTMVPSFDQAAFSLQPGVLSDPVKSQFGFHVIRVDTHDFKSFEEMRPELEKKLRPELAQKALEDLQKKANVVLDPEYYNVAKQ
jgi:peptidyl-prolyl cis-trans isomerase C